MINKLINYLKDKKILILGFGLEGYSTYSFIRRHLPTQELFLSDVNPNFLDKYPKLEEDKYIVVIDESMYLKDLDNYDIILKTPGISFKDIDISKIKDKIKSQLELFLQYINVFTIGITGTKGKSTTSTLIYNVIKNQKDDVHLLGNIGIPLFDEIDNLKEDSIVILELSSHQLEFVTSSPNIAIILNIFEEHLDHCNSYEEYINAKLNICKYQTSNDYFLYNIDNVCLNNHVINITNLKQQVYEISYDNNKKNNKDHYLITKKNNKVINENNEILYIDSDKRKVLGEHNFNNIMFVVTVAKILDLDVNKVTQDIIDSEPLPHRMEFVGNYNGVEYYNDSIATIPEATINCVETLKNVNTLIIGGVDRGIDYSKLIEFLNTSNIENLICLPDTGWNIANNINNNVMKKYLVNNMDEAIEVAKINTKKDTICLLSPAAASYGFFKNFQERGNKFKELVKKMEDI